MSTNGSILAVTDLHMHFPIRKGLLWERTVGEVKAVDGVSFEIPEGKTLGLVGESGSGKSTTGYCILQLLRPTSGSIRFMGKELTELKGEALRRMRREMQIVFQDPYSSLNPRMTVGDIVGEPLVVHGVGSRRDRSARSRSGTSPGTRTSGAPSRTPLHTRPSSARRRRRSESADRVRPAAIGRVLPQPRARSP